MKIVGLGIYARLKANSTATAKCKYFFGILFTAQVPNLPKICAIWAQLTHVTERWKSNLCNQLGSVYFCYV